MLTRRKLLRNSFGLIVGGAIAPHMLSSKVVAISAGDVRIPPISKRTLIVVQLKGGNDGLNTLVPYDEGKYYDERRELAIPQKHVLPLNKRVGLNPAMSAFLQLWEEGVLAIVEGVGYENPNYSHFQSTHIWQTADPTSRLSEGHHGWLGRYLALEDRGSQGFFKGLSVGRVLSNTLRGSYSAIPTVSSLNSYRLQADPKQRQMGQLQVQAIMGLYDDSQNPGRYTQLFKNEFMSAYESSEALIKADETYRPIAQYPDTRFAQELKLLASVITQNLGMRVGHVTLSGFDTHAGQKGEHEQLLTVLSEGLNSFYRDLQSHGVDRDVVIMTWSEFGRRVKGNASDGTDHGSAAPLFILGTPVRGGLYGEQPTFLNLDSGNLRFTTDFRNVYKTVLEDWLEMPSTMIFQAKNLESFNLFHT